MSYWPLNTEGEMYIEALTEEATRPLPIERTLQDLMAERRALVLEQSHAGDPIEHGLLQFAIDQIDREVHERLEQERK